MDLERIRKNIYHSYNEEYLKKILVNFYNQTLDTNNFNIENRNINKVLNSFFEDLIYNAKSKNGRYSPKEIIDNDNLLETALTYINEHKNFYHQKSVEANLRDFFFSSSMVGKVTNFNPVIARKIYEKYLPYENATIFDYSCVFGNRMLEALTSKYNYHYIGVDPYEELYKRLLTFSKWIKDNLNNKAITEIFNTGSEQYIPKLKEKIDLSFSSPPYFNYETYTNCNTQSYIKYNTYDSWLENYVKKTPENIYMYTKENGLHLVNPEDTKRIKLLNDWLDIATQVGFTLEEIETLSTRKRFSNKNSNKLLVMRQSNSHNC